MNVGLAYTPQGLARGEILAVEDETTWIRDLYQLQLDKNRANDINLVFQIMEYGQGRSFHSVSEVKQDYQPIAYGVLKLNNQDATIRYGTYEIELYKPPVNLNKKLPIDLLKQTIKVTISQPPFLNSKP